MQQSETVVSSSRFRVFVFQHWHIICASIFLLIALLFVILGIAQSVVGLKSYPAWVSIPWASFNVVFFLISALLALPYILRSVKNPKEDASAVAAIVVGVIYFVGLLISSGPSVEPIAVFSWLGMFSFLAFLITDITLIVMEKK